tara:strand:+ start:3824 stop:4378 length:555 start_codon:yes stop_codon:yes gene_type:complete
MSYSFDVNKWMKERKEKRYNGAKALHGFKEFMLSKGFKYLVIHFDGAGDSGECYEMEGYKSIKSFNKRDFGSEYISFRDWSNKDANGDPAVIPEKEAYEKGTRNQYSVFKALKEWNKKSGEDIDHWKIVDLIDYDWYNNDGGQGCVVFDLKEGLIEVQGEQNCMSQIDVTERLYTDGRKAEYSY